MSKRRKQGAFSTWGIGLAKGGGLASFFNSGRKGKRGGGVFASMAKGGAFKSAFSAAFAGAFSGTFGSMTWGRKKDRARQGMFSTLTKRRRRDKDKLETGMFQRLDRNKKGSFGQPLTLTQETHTPRESAWGQGSFFATPDMAARDTIIHAPWATTSAVAVYDAYTLQDLYKARQEINKLINQRKGDQGMDADLSAFGARGQVVRAYGMDPSSRYDLQYEVVELDDVIASNTLGGGINPLYPEELQPRDRTRAASQAQIQSIVSNFVPGAFVDEFMTIDRGAPIIGGDMAVESGNGRVLALLTLREVAPSKYDEYRTAVLARARELGIDTEAVQGMSNPVLVRRRISDVDRVAFAREANQETILGQSAVEVARQDADLISDEMIDSLQIGETQTPDEALRSSRNTDFVRSFLQRLPENERAELMTAEGEISQSLINRLKAAIFSKAFPTSGDLGGRIFESVDDNVRNLTGGLMGAIVQLVKAERLAGAGLRSADLTIAEDLAAAVQKFSDLREQRMSVDDYMRQGKLFGEDLTETQLQILAALDERSRSSKQVRELIGGWADLVEQSPNPNQANMFGDAPPGKEELIVRWL
jgi:hypothetical protein